MKRLIFFFTGLALLLVNMSIAAQESGSVDREQLSAMADSAYTDDNFEMAADIYKTLIDDYGPSAKLYYNLGNCYYRLGRNGNAIVAYERALRLDPTDKDAKFNLDFVNSRITDRPGERGTFVGNALDYIALSLHPNFWAWAAFGLFVLAVGGVILYFFTSGVILRKTGFFGGIVAMLLFIVTVFIATRAAAISSDNSKAIVTVPSTILSTVPRDPGSRAQEAMLLHEGTKVTILDSVVTISPVDSIRKTWFDVEVDNAHRAWIDGAAVERI
ncbi:MAG: tetratricopeptide repeat protein [Duncaniella sp.]|nr:tetratricopeptide repeat protein [Duncaniella sp.]